MSDLESSRPDEEGAETEPPSLENGKSQELDNATHEPVAKIETTQSYEVAEGIEKAFTELLSDATDESELSEVLTEPVLETPENDSGDKISEQPTEETPPLFPEMPQSEFDVLPHTAVGKGPVPSFSPILTDNQTQTAPESSLEPSEAVVDVLARVLNDSDYRQQFFSNPGEALAEYDLTPEEHATLETLQEQSVTDFSSELDRRDVSDEDIKRLLGNK